MIGVFGDSFADITPGAWNNQHHLGYPMLLSEHVQGYAKSGTSHFWSFQQFLKHHHQFRKIIFVHASSSRWCHLPASVPVQMQYHVFPDDVPEFPELMELNKYFFDVFPDELRTFISDNIFQTVNQICHEKNIHLVNIMVHDTQMEAHHRIAVPFPVLVDVDGVSRKEMMITEAGCVSITEHLHHHRIPDVRPCHLSLENNRIMADVVQSFVTPGCHPGIYNLVDNYNWRFTPYEDT